MQHDAQHIQRAFNRAAHTYDQHCQVQLSSGEKLLSLLNPTFKPSTILDLGCGTGIVTEKIAQQFDCADITAIDIAPALLNFAKHRLTPYSATCYTEDFNHFTSQTKFDLIYSNMALHWSNDIILTILNMKKYLAPNGLFAFSIPLPHTFHELQPEFAINSFINLASLLSQLSQQSLQIITGTHETITQFFPDTMSALRSIKAVGANHVSCKTHHSLRGKDVIKNHHIQQLTYEIGYVLLS